jgi:hypothetical protein
MITGGPCPHLAYTIKRRVTDDQAQDHDCADPSSVDARRYGITR